MGLLQRNAAKVQTLTPLGIWLFIVGRVIAAFGIGVLVAKYIPTVSWIGIPAVVVGLAILILAFCFFVRKG